MVDKPGTRREKVTLALLVHNSSIFIQAMVFGLLYVELTNSILNLYMPSKSSHLLPPVTLKKRSTLSLIFNLTLHPQPDPSSSV